MGRWKPAAYEVIAKALKDHFDARSYLYDDLVPAFPGHREAIEGVACGVFEMKGARDIVLQQRPVHSGKREGALRNVLEITSRYAAFRERML
ncbi:DUF1488 family protein [Cupriavidus sp. UYPR2.512]|uniref:DUF1488 family protein n=1 Tax=Cupriavidus sp. UYPR2.512 TaxID=1080187 RepID=UPI00351078FE